MGVLDDFREWLSDYLRYFMLGGAILLVLLLLFFGIRACVRFRGGSEETVQSQTEQTTASVEDTASAQTEAGDTTDQTAAGTTADTQTTAEDTASAQTGDATTDTDTAQATPTPVPDTTSVDAEETPSEPSGTRMVVNDDANVRDSASGDIIGGLDYGTEVIVTGEEDMWYQIAYNGGTGYVYKELLNPVN